VNPACFSLRKIDARIDLVAALPGKPNRAFLGHAFNAPTLHFYASSLSLFRPVLLRPKAQGILRRIPVNFGQTSPAPAASTGRAEWSFRNPFWMTGGDPKHTRAEQEES
jgi:hypothetical protein